MDEEVKSKIRVSLVDDHKVVRYGLQRLIEACEDMEVVGTASSGEESLEKLENWQPDVIVMDLLLQGGMDGIETTRRIRQLHPATQVVVLTSYTDDARVIAALRAGAIGYIRKEAEPEVLLKAIRAAATNQAVFDPSIEDSVWQDWERQASHKYGLHALTEREQTVVRHLAQGQTNREIAQDLTVSEETVKTHVTSILTKLGLTHRHQVMLYALKQGFIRLDELNP